MKCPVTYCENDGFYEEGAFDYCDEHVPLSYFEPERSVLESSIVLGRDLESE